ncbi:MAG TPA: phosphatidylserine decarboxylase family protein [Saprospiraceae bacterium]|nr:phosphatidylserine decarboxylase family protein [Saprospiraceae bacterium]
MRIHKEGVKPIAVFFLILAGLLWGFSLFVPSWLFYVLLVAALIFWGLIISFFRHPVRETAKEDERWIYAPADGKVVVIEETEEKEYFQDRRIQISIFMSPLNVHVNRVPIGGKVTYVKHHPGRYFVAWHPKSSAENERTTTVIQTNKAPILIRQIAGAVARRIRTYVQKGEQVKQGQELGFIKFGSRVDLFLPLEAKIKVAPGQEVKGNLDLIAEI